MFFGPCANQVLSLAAFVALALVGAPSWCPAQQEQNQRRDQVQPPGQPDGAGGREHPASAPQEPPRGQVADRRGGFSEAFRADLQKTLEKRRQRRARLEARTAPNAIIPWPMPPALIIRATPEIHGEIEALLGTLRYAP